MRRALLFPLAAILVLLTAQVGDATQLSDDGPGGQRLVADLGPEADPRADGDFVGAFNPGEAVVCYELSYSGTAPAIAAHIHRGRAGVNGPIVITFDAVKPGTSSPWSGCEGPDSGQPADLIRQILDDPAGFYVNVHSPLFPGGAARGQLGK